MRKSQLGKSLTKGILLFGFLLLGSNAYPAGCVVSNFKGTVLSIHLESKRAEAATQWLRSEVDSCSAEKLSIIRNNSRSWLGTALNPEIEALIEAAIEAKAANDPELLKKLFEPVIAAPVNSGVTPTAEASNSPTPRAPVVAPSNANVNISGNMAYVDARGASSAKEPAKPGDAEKEGDSAPSYQRKVELERQARWSREIGQKISGVNAETEEAKKLQNELLKEVRAPQPDQSYQKRVEWEQSVLQRLDALRNMVRK
jgi:hypothetical protein